MYIERVTHEIGKQRRVRVVTSDGAEQSSSWARGAAGLLPVVPTGSGRSRTGDPRPAARLRRKTLMTEITSEFVWSRIRPRPRTATRTFGSVLGSGRAAPAIGAAALLAAEGALRAGAGLVTLASVEPVLAAASARLPECCLLPCIDGAEGGISPESLPLLRRQKAAVLLAGPGLGYTAQSTARAAETRTLIQQLLSGFAGCAVAGRRRVEAAAGRCLPVSPFPIRGGLGADPAPPERWPGSPV